jgi:DNA-directed RNA polymerase alpha subunit
MSHQIRVVGSRTVLAELLHQLVFTNVEGVHTLTLNLSPADLETLRARVPAELKSLLGLAASANGTLEDSGLQPILIERQVAETHQSRNIVELVPDKERKGSVALRVLERARITQIDQLITTPHQTLREITGCNRYMIRNIRRWLLNYQLDLYGPIGPNGLLWYPIDQLQLSTRAYTGLMSACIFSVDALIRSTEEELISFECVGPACIAEYQLSLAKFGLSLNMKLPHPRDG